MSTWTDVITDAFREIRVARAGDVLAPEMLDEGQRTANGILDLWNAKRRAVYADVISDFTLTANLSPHTIGPTGTFVLAQRPVRIDAVQLNLGGSPNVFTPINVRDASWFRSRGVPSITTSTPTDVFYNPTWPNGTLYFYGIPTTAYGVRLWSAVLLAAITDPTLTFSLPPGYERALMLTTAEALAPGNGQTVSQTTKDASRDARDTIFGNNDVIPDLVTLDAGMPGVRGRGYNFRTGEIE